MKPIIQDMKEMSDSRELLEARPHPIISVFIYLLIGMLLIALMWSYFGEIDENVKAQGIVRPNEKISSIKNKIAGKVISVKLEEGKSVKKGEELFSIEHESLDLQKVYISNDYEKAKQELSNLKKFKQSILDSKNYFQENNALEKDYFNKFIKYQTDIEVQSKQTQLDSSSAGQVGDTLRSLMTLKQSVEQNRSLFIEKNSVYYNQFIDYSLNIQKLKDILSQSKENYISSKELYDAGAISKKDMEDSKKQFDTAGLELQKYENEFLLDINTKIEENRKSQSQLGISLKASDQSMGGTQEADQVSIQKYKMDTLVQTETDIETFEKNVDKLKSDIASVNMNIQDCTVYAPIDGVVNVSSEINTGDLLQIGTELATIVPDSNTKYKIQLYVSNSDIAKIKEGEKIKYHFLALPFKEYGEVAGVIKKIGSDAKIDQEKGTSYYIVEAAIDNKPLYSYKGVKAEIKVGMACEAQVITSSKRILNYLLEKINLKN